MNDLGLALYILWAGFTLFLGVALGGVAAMALIVTWAAGVYLAGLALIINQDRKRRKTIKGLRWWQDGPAGAGRAERQI